MVEVTIGFGSLTFNIQKIDSLSLRNGCLKMWLPPSNCRTLKNRAFEKQEKCKAIPGQALTFPGVWYLTLWRLMSYIYMEYPFLMFLDHTQRRSTVGRTSSGRVISSSQRPLPDNTRHSQQTNIHAPGGIRTHDLSRWAAAGHCLFVVVFVTRLLSL